MRRETAIRNLTKRANDFVGMTLDQMLTKFTYVSEGRVWFNANQTQQMYWMRLGCPQNAEEAINGDLPQVTFMSGPRVV